MNQMQRIAAVLLYGVVVGKRKTKKYEILLYQIDNFYVAAYFSLSTGRILRYRSFEDTEQLKPYTQDINIDELL